MVKEMYMRFIRNMTEGTWMPNCAYSVSYPHLDVYKRQEWQYTVKYVDEATGDDIISPIPYVTTDNVVMVSYLPIDN